MQSPTNHAPVRAFALAAGVVSGAGCLIWIWALISLFGDAADTGITLTLLGAVGLTLGLSRYGLGTHPVSSPGRTIGTRWMAVGALTIALSSIRSSGTVLGWVGVSPDSGAVFTLVARVALGALLILPATVAVGSSLRCAARLSASFPSVLPWGILGATIGAAAASGAAVLNAPSAQFSGLIVGAGAIGLGAVLFPRRFRAPSVEGRTAQAPTPFWGAFAAGLLLFSMAHFSPRIMASVFGNELPSVPVAQFSFLLTVAAGAAAGAWIASRLRSTPAIAVFQVLVALAGTAAILVLGNHEALPDRFAGVVESAESLADIARGGIVMVTGRIGLFGALLGAAIALLVSTIRAGDAAPEAWLASAGAGGMVGAVLGSFLPAPALSLWGIPGVLASVAILSVLGATVSVARMPLPGFRKLALVIVSPGVVAAAVLRAPAVDSERLLVDRDLQAAMIKLPFTPKSWTEFEAEDPRLSAAVRKRGHQKRLLVNGRLEMGRETSEKAHGVLAHLPLSVHPSPDRVLVLGAGTGWALRSTLAHPVERVECFEVSQVLVDAATAFDLQGPETFTDERLRVRIGDHRDLLSRSEPFDAILSHASGSWTDRSAAVSTGEFLSLARDHLAEDGLLAQWVPSESLTKTGFQILLATYASVFPQVELWDGGTGDVVILARKNAARHDFENLLNSYRQPGTARALEDSWIGSPETLLSLFLAEDATVRRIAGAASTHSQGDPQLGRAEAARRRTELAVNPVPGLAALRTDPTALFVNTPRVGFREAVRNVLRARDLERAALDLELNDEPYEAASTYQEALQLNPRDRSVRRGYATLRSRMGIEYARKEEFTAAHAYLREAVETDTTYATGFANLGQLLLQSEDYDYAISTLQQAILLAPDDDLFLLQLGRTWKTRGYLDEALPYYERALEINPLNVEVAMGYIDTKLAMRGAAADLREGLDFLEKYLEVDPTDEDLIYLIGKFRDAVSRGFTGADRP